MLSPCQESTRSKYEDVLRDFRKSKEFSAGAKKEAGEMVGELQRAKVQMERVLCKPGTYESIKDSLVKGANVAKQAQTAMKDMRGKMQHAPSVSGSRQSRSRNK